LFGLSEAAEKIGFHTLGVQISYEKLLEVPLPCIVHWNKNHFAVLYKIKKNINFSIFKKYHKSNTIYISDPAHGKLEYTTEQFIKHWIGNNANETTEEGVTLIIEPIPKFYNDTLVDGKAIKFDFEFISKYLFRYKKFVIQLIIGLLAGSLLQLIVPFLTQSIVDVGIQNQDINFIYLILFTQLFLFLGRTALEVIRSWILLHLSSRINISLISDFFIKLMNLPIAFFDSKMTGDLLQRINDHKRIEKILTTSSLNVLFSMVNLIIFGFVLAYYSLQIFSIFLLGSMLYFAWVLFFFKRRKDLDYKRFSEVSQEQSKVIELINGMQEIKLHNAERQMRWNWEFVQARLFRVGMKSLALEQTQSVGSSFINELKNILITVLSAKLFFAAGCEKVLIPACQKSPLLKADIEQIESLIIEKNLNLNKTPLSSAHPQGGAKMGIDPKNSVCNLYGKVYGTKSIYVCDASLSPTSVKVNPYETIMVLSKWVAENLFT